MRGWTAALLAAALLGGCGGESDRVTVEKQPVAEVLPTPNVVPEKPPAPAEPAFRPMGAGERPAAAAAGKRLVGKLAKSDKPPTTGSAQVTLVNQTSLTLDLYVDGGYGCRALRTLMCTTQVTPGTLALEARGPGGESASDVVVVEQGSSFTWTITE
jgi:hypothetical protein